MTGYDRRRQVAQWVGVHTNTRGVPFMVFNTGDQRYYLFRQCYPGTLTNTGLEFPVERRRLTREVRAALAHGVGRWRERVPRQEDTVCLRPCCWAQGSAG